MAFHLNDVVPWGRSLKEYVQMFDLTAADLNKKIVSFADGPASFNAEAKTAGYDVTSLDIVYQFSAAEIKGRIDETKEIVLEQTKKNAENYNWHEIKDITELEKIRMGAMEKFLQDYDHGKREKRYLFHEFPCQTPFAENHFDLGLCSHFLFLYPGLGYSFHLETLEEMIRICQEVRVSPLVDLDGTRPEFFQRLMEELGERYTVAVCQTDYAFLKSENSYLSIMKS